jgi:hypothetical protein
MRYVIGGLVLLVWVAFMWVSGVSNVSLATSWATSDREYWALFAGALAADAMKALMPVAVLLCLARRAWTPMLAAAVLFVVCQGFAGWAALSFASKTRTAFGDTQKTAATDRLRIEDKRGQAKSDLDWLPRARPVAVVEAELTRQEAEPRFAGSAGCTAARSNYDTKFCRGVFELRQEKATALNRAILTGKIEEFDAQLAGMATATGDTQLAAMEDLTGAAPERLIALMSVLMAVMVELGSALGLTVATGLLAAERRQPAREAPRAAEAIPEVVRASRPARARADRLEPLAA